MNKYSRIFWMLVFVIALILGTSEGSAANVARWSDLQLFEQKFKSIPVKDEIKQAELIAQVADHVTKLVPKQKQKLDGAQVRDLVQILRVIGSADLGNVILENNLILIQTNAKAILAEIRKLPPKEAAELAEAVDSVLGGAITSDPQYLHFNNKPASGKKQPEVPVKKN
jgi:hypothetical protein